jgi:hypothetical protein
MMQIEVAGAAIPAMTSESIEIQTKFPIRVLNPTRIDAALIPHNISRSAGDGILRFDCTIQLLQFNLHHWEVPTFWSLFRLTVFRSASLMLDFRRNPSKTFLVTNSSNPSSSGLYLRRTSIQAHRAIEESKSLLEVSHTYGKQRICGADLRVIGHGNITMGKHMSCSDGLYRDERCLTKVGTDGIPPRMISEVMDSLDQDQLTDCIAVSLYRTTRYHPVG